MTDAAELFRAKGAAWSPSAPGDEVDFAPEDYGSGTSELVPVSLGLLQHLGAEVAPFVKPDIAAATVVAKLAGAHPLSSSWAASAVVTSASGQWLATGRGSEEGLSGPVVTVDVYRWSGAQWALQGDAAGVASGSLGEGGSIIAASLTGSSQPDFAINSSGADTLWLSVISAVGGKWHAVAFDYGYGPTTAVDGRVVDHLVETEVDGCGCAAGPETSLWEAYSNGVFEPVSPPGPVPVCSTTALAMAVDPGSAQGIVFTKAKCADGWALAVGTGEGFSSQVVGLFEQQRDHWQAITLDDGDGLGLAPSVYDIPASLLEMLGEGTGSSVAPAIASTALARSCGDSANEMCALSGVMPSDGSDWLLRAIQSTRRNTASFTVYAWSGRAWDMQGNVGPVVDRGSILGLPGWYQAVTTSSGSAPELVVRGAAVAWTVVLSYSGGAWRAGP
jgi:hypothetical protein